MKTMQAAHVTVIVLAACWAWAPVKAAESLITVEGSGRVEVLPDAVELTGTITGQAELAVDAVVKYRDSKRRVEEALKALQIEQLSVKWDGIRVGPGIPDSQAAQLAAMRGQPQPEDNRVSVTDSATLVLSGLDKLGDEALLDTLVRLIDASKDAGLTIPPTGQQTLASFRLIQSDSAEKQAYAAAMKDARTHAEEIAKLAGVKLGLVSSVEVTSKSKSAQSANMLYPYYNPYVYRFPQSASSAEVFSSMQMTAIPVEVTLKVQFNIGAL